MAKKPLNLIFVGRSGCGKGTQIGLLKKIFPNMIVISTGNEMRDLALQNTDAGKRVKAILDTGGLPFYQMATTLWMHKIAYTLKEDQGLACDGFPRRTDEAQNLFEFLTWLERADDTKAIILNISRKEAFDRLIKRGRERDNESDINNRLDWYEERVVPTIDFLKKKCMAIEINGEQSIEAIHEDIKKALKI